MRMQQYKGDLSVSCLRLVLSLPLEIVVLDVASLVPAMKVRYARVMMTYLRRFKYKTTKRCGHMN